MQKLNFKNNIKLTLRKMKLFKKYDLSNNESNYSNRLCAHLWTSENIDLSRFIHNQAPNLCNPGITVTVLRWFLIMATRTRTPAMWPMLVATTTITLTMPVRSTSMSTTTPTTRTRTIPVVSFRPKPIQSNSTIMDIPRILKSIATKVESFYALRQFDTFFSASLINRTGIIAYV